MQNRTVVDGIVFEKFSLEYRHDIDGQTFSVDIWAVDHADAVERLEYIKQNGTISGKVERNNNGT